MLNTTLLLGFIAAALIVLITPGPGVLYVVARSTSQGYRAGIISAFGLAFGALAHVVAAAIGLSALLLTSATAFGIVKTIGALYLIYLGLKALRATDVVNEEKNVLPVPLKRIWVDGVIVSLFNPKIAVFFLAFLPQFVDPAAGPITIQILLLGFIYASLAFLTDSGYALMARKIRILLGTPAWIRNSVPRYLTGGLYIGLGLYTAFSDRRQ